jgi:drug/metabolite transporter (DMT)-like permease
MHPGSWGERGSKVSNRLGGGLSLDVGRGGWLECLRMEFRVHLLLPLASSLLYVLGVLLVKRASDLGVGVWRTTFVANVAMALVFVPLWLVPGDGVPWERLWQPGLVAGLLLAGQVAGFYALSRGDVSVATPVLGIKVILVALWTTWMLGEVVPPRLWLAAGLSTAAIGLLGYRGGVGHRRTGLTILCALVSAVVFALFDVLVQQWSPGWGATRFLPLLAGMVAAYSVVLVRFFSAPLGKVPRGAWPWLLTGAGILAVQSVIFIFAVARFGDATAANVVYNARGFWTVVAVWLVGHWFVNREQGLETRVLRRRLVGAAVMSASIVLVLI